MYELEDGVYAVPSIVPDYKDSLFLVFVCNKRAGTGFNPVKRSVSEIDFDAGDVSGWLRIADLPPAPRMKEPKQIGSVVVATWAGKSGRAVRVSNNSAWAWYHPESLEVLNWRQLDSPRHLTGEEIDALYREQR